MLPMAGGKVKNAQNHRQIDTRSEAEGIIPVIYGILYYRASEVGIILYFISIPGHKVEYLFCAP